MQVPSSGIYSPINPSQEELVRDLLMALIPGVSVTVSNDIGHMGLLERENAAILNECLKPLCQWTLMGLQEAVRDIGIHCPMYLTQNDGTLVRYKQC